MLEAYKELIGRQYEAALCMLGACIERCPEDRWHEPVANLTFCQAAFHTLFFTDVYLDRDLESVRAQPFHDAHASEFADYEELAGRVQRLLYERPFVREYLRHCREKAGRTLAVADEESLAARAAFEWLDLSHAELHVYNIRHVHHHAAQLSLRLRLDTGEGVPWVGSGWRDV